MQDLAKRILDELVVIGFARATDYLYTQGDTLVIRDTDQLPPDAGAAIAGMERSSTGIKLKFYDKLKALEILGKCCGLFDGSVNTEENNLLQQVLLATKEANHDLLPIQPQAADGYDLVEQG